MTRLIAPLAPIALIVFSTMIYQANASNAPSDAQAEAAGVQALVPANCRPQNPTTRIYDLVGIDTRVAGGIMVRHPERLREVCAIVNKSLMNVSLRELKNNRTMQDVGKEHANNDELLRLAASLNMSAEEGKALVRARGREVLTDAAAQKSAANTGASPAPTVVANNLEKTPTSLSGAPVPNGTGLTVGNGSSTGLQYGSSNNFGL